MTLGRPMLFLAAAVVIAATFVAIASERRGGRGRRRDSRSPPIHWPATWRSTSRARA